MLKLCREHRLFSALIYMFTRGLSDYVAPAVELLLALAFALPPSATDSSALHSGAHPTPDPSERNAKAFGYTLLVYLRCCMRGQQFPPGAGSLPPQQAGVTKAALLGAWH